MSQKAVTDEIETNKIIAYEHPRGYSELIGDYAYPYYGIAYYEQMTKNVSFNTVEIAVSLKDEYNSNLQIAIYETSSPNRYLGTL